MRTRFYRLSALLLCLAVFTASDLFAEKAKSDKSEKKEHVSSVDHSKLEALQREFKSPQEVTKTCLSCHTERHTEIMNTAHWTWDRETDLKGRGGMAIGKTNVINNFCIGVTSNEPRCTSCHIGFGWKNQKFDFSKEENIDCMVCHDQTNTYKKFPTGAGLPVKEKKLFAGKKVFLPPDFKNIAQNVGLPTRDNCGTCHFFGGGGNNVKHGDMEKALSKPTKDIDIHMAVDGEDMSCTSCHETDKHVIKGRLYSTSSVDTNRVNCITCHEAPTHKSAMLEEHTIRIACQTCHIPKYAKANATKMYWDWSTAGKKDENGKGIVKKDKDGNITYHFKKGTFVWERNVTPEYYWFNGSAQHILIEDKIDPSSPVQMNELNGSYADKSSKIWPVKVHRGKQMYDEEHSTFILPKLFGKKETGAYWKNFDWQKAAAAGMKAAHRPFSGKIGWVETEMYWPLNHMVSAKEEALQCTDCHSPNGRLANLNDFYLPGRDRSDVLDTLGLVMIGLVILGTVVHGSMRVVMKNKNAN